MVSIESPLMVSYLTSIVSNIVSLIVFEISDAEVCALVIEQSIVFGGVRVSPCNNVKLLTPHASPSN